MATLVDIGRSLATSGITRLLFVNGHGGNSALGQVANRELRRRFGLRTFFTHPGVPVDQGGRARRRRSTAWACTAGTARRR